MTRQLLTVFAVGLATFVVGFKLDHFHGFPIYGGQIVHKCQVPFYVYVPVQTRLANGREVNGTCGGILLNSQWVLTNAHCLNRATRAALWFGVTDTRTIYEDQNVQRRAIAKVVFHEGFNMSAGIVKNDLCLVKTSSPVDLNRAVGPVVISKSQSLFQDGMNYVVYGLGANGFDKDVYPIFDPELRYANVPIIPRDRCKQLLDAISRGSRLEDTYFCAGFDHAGILYGDSGGPLTAGDGNVAVGMTQALMGFDNGTIATQQSKYPALFVTLKDYCDWLKTKSDNSFECSS
ncbi:hypothetical protein L596_012256 [Steinernema carpocapsae]|uniref:Peptidase S1 domain-containing protein n=1 Tax=Steinernema carpocapsae TaxID=34508 RepID=A0A4U5NX56_STECR|nr:hypothetical protein L596_012256 [Steinernema carpocapsae]